MDHISHSLPNLNAPTQQQHAASKSPGNNDKLAMQREETINFLVRQSFDIFNTFGKDPDCLETMVPAFCEVLQARHPNTITEAFRLWMLKNEKMPTPSNIAGLCVEAEAAKEIQRRSSSGQKFAAAEWIQVIRDDETKAIVAEINPGQHLAPFEITRDYPGCHLSMRRAD